jgi:DNA-binding transcriptional regulator LsrR (DeoR family)
LGGSPVGDMGGIIIPKRDLTTEKAHKIDELNQRWTGIQQRHIEHCAKNADEKRPGVILLAIGERRYHVVMRCIELGLVNELVIDQALARTMETALKARRHTALAGEKRNGKPAGRHAK